MAYRTIWNHIRFNKLMYNGMSAQVTHCCPEVYRGAPSDIIVAAARVSFNGKEYTDPGKNKRLLKRLYDDAHTSPFEMASMTFKVRIPKFVAVQLLRHRTFKFNELSQRYREIKLGYFDPSVSPEHIRTQDKKNKQHSYRDPEQEEKYIAHVKKINEKLDEIIQLYHEGVEMGMAKEMARYCLPMSTWTELVFQCDANNMIKFFRLRMAEDAQYEIRILASMMYHLFGEFFPVLGEMVEMDPLRLKYEVYREDVPNETNEEVPIEF